jgi:predicted MFS family arabinose efflux permease
LWSLADPRRYLFLDLTYLAFGVGYIAYATFAVALFRAHGVPAGGVGLAWTLIGLSGTAGAYAAGRLLDSAHKDRVLAFGAAGCAFAATSSLGGALASAVLFGIGMPVTPAAITAIIRDRSSARSYPASYSAVTSLLCIGQFLGPLAVGPFVDRYGLGAVATFSAIVYLAGPYSRRATRGSRRPPT